MSGARPATAVGFGASRGGACRAVLSAVASGEGGSPKGRRRAKAGWLSDLIAMVIRADDYMNDVEPIIQGLTEQLIDHAVEERH